MKKFKGHINKTKKLLAMVLIAFVSVTLLSTVSAYADINSTIFVSGIYNPRGIAIDSSGNILIADETKREIKKFDANGNLISTISGLYMPRGIAIDSSGNIFITEVRSSKDSEYGDIKKFDANGNLIGTISGLKEPAGIVVDSSGNIFVGEHKLVGDIKKFDANGNLISTISGISSTYGIGMTIDSNGNILVGEYNDIKKFDANGNLISIISGLNSAASGIVTDSSGNIFVSGYVSKDIKKFDANGNFISTISCYGGTCDMAIDSSGNIFASNWQLGKVYKITEASADDMVLPETSSTTPAAVKIEGTEKVGQTLEAQLLTDDGEKFTTSSAVTYDWYRLDDSNSEFSNKIGTDKTYTLTRDDLNKYIGVHATYDGNTFSNTIGKILSNSSSSHHRSSSTTSIDTDATSTSDAVTNIGTTNNSNSNNNKVGWTQDANGKWYLIKDNGDKTTGWKLVDNKWYFFDNNSRVMVTGWYKAEEGDWTYDGKDTVGQWFHLDVDGKMNTGWFKDTDGSWYFLCDGKDYGALGVIETGWKHIDSKWYYFNTNGVMASDTVVDGYILGSDGAWIE